MLCMPCADPAPGLGLHGAHGLDLELWVLLAAQGAGIECLLEAVPHWTALHAGSGMHVCLGHDPDWPQSQCLGSVLWGATSSAHPTPC